LMEVLNFYHFVLPGFYKFNIKDFILYKQIIEWDFIFLTLSYGIVYILFLTILSIIIFEKKNLD